MILALSNKSNQTEYALVDSDKKIVTSGTIVDDSSDVLGEVLIDGGIDRSSIEYIASESELESDLEIGNILVDPISTEISSLSVGKEEDDDKQYPFIIWIDNQNNPGIVLVESVGKHQKLKSAATSSKEFFGDIAKHLQQDDLNTSAELGDSTDLKIKINYEDKQINREELKQELDRLIEANLAEIPQANIQVKDELQKFFKQDLAAAVKELYYNSIILSLVETSEGLGVMNFAVTGDSIYDETFLNILNKFSKEVGFNINLPKIDIAENRAIAIAAAAYDRLNK